MGIFGGLILRENVLNKLLSLNTVLADPIVPLNKDLTNFSTNNTNAQTAITGSIISDATYYNAFCFGQSNNILNQDLPYLRRCLISNDPAIASNWAWYENASGPINILPAGSSGAWDDWQLFMRTVIINDDDLIGDGRTYISWYNGGQSAGTYSVGIATSNDLLTWTKYAGNPIFQDLNSGVYPGGTTSTRIVRLSANNYVMIYIGAETIPYKANKATSTDGINWTIQERGLFGDINCDLSEVTKINSTYYFLLNKIAVDGNDCDPTGSRVTNRGPFRDVHVYSTADFITYVDRGAIISDISEIGEGNRVSGPIFNHDGEYLASISRYKWDIQAFNGLTNGEQFAETHIIKATFAGLSISGNNIAYPSYVDYYDVTQLKEVTGTGYTGSWAVSPQIDMVNWIYPTTDGIQFTSKNVDVDNFAIKFKIQFPPTYSSATFGGYLCAIQDTGGDNTNSNFLLFLNGGSGDIDMVVVLYNSSGTIAKNYRTTLNIDNYIPSVAANNTLDLGFIFNAGTLKLCAGYNTNIPTDKATDTTLTQLNTTTSPLSIGTNGTRSVFAGLNMTGVVIINGTEATEENWLKLTIT